MIIRPFEPADWPSMWPVIRSVAEAGDTYAYPPDLAEEDARRQWIDEPTYTAVALDDDGTLLGFGKIMPVRPGPGAHVANGSYMVASARRGTGIGRKLVEHTLNKARDAGFRAIQFNAVVSTNTGAVKLYQDLGFAIIGTSPDAFRLPSGGYAGLHIMHRFL